MKIEGQIKKTKKWWAVEVPLLLVFSQGRTKKEALSMIKEAVKDLVDVKGFKVSVCDVEEDTFSLRSNDINRLMSFVLKQQRFYHKRSIRDVARELGSSSPTAYSRYESGKTKLNFDKFTQILKAIRKGEELILKIG